MSIPRGLIRGSGDMAATPSGHPATRAVLSLNQRHVAALPPPPELLGFKGETARRFAQYRPWQEASILTSMDAPTRAVMECLPTGAGKTLTYIAEAIMSGGRVIVLTSTKGQQDQIMASFPQHDMPPGVTIADVRGQMNYRCEAAMRGGQYEMVNPNSRWWPVADGPCMDGAGCTLMEAGCGYFDAIRAVKRATIGVTNYAFWLYNARMRPEYRLFNGAEASDILICDEAHEMVEELCSFMAAEITRDHERHISTLLGMRMPDTTNLDIGAWREFGEAMSVRAMVKLDEMRQEMAGSLMGGGLLRTKREIRKLEMLGGALSAMKDEANWVADNDNLGTQEGLIRFDPVWPMKEAERLLFRGAKKVIFSSATARMKHASLMGMGDDAVTMFESPSSFDPAYRPIYHIPCVQMNYRNERAMREERKWPWIETGDRIMSARQGRKGIVHTVSYERRNLLMQHPPYGSTHSARLRSHTKSDARAVIADFKSSYGTPDVLASPSVTTGYDFPYEECEWTWVPKVPMPDTRSRVMKARVKADRAYGDSLTATALMQMCGRGDRAPDDWCETFITDDNIRWFWRAHREYEKGGDGLLADWWLRRFIKWRGEGAYALPPALDRPGQRVRYLDSRQTHRVG